MRLVFAALMVLAAACPLCGQDLATELDGVRLLQQQGRDQLAANRVATPSETGVRIGEQQKRVSEAAIAVFHRYPTDPRRWEAALIALQTLRGFVVAYQPGYDEAMAARDLPRAQSLIVRDEDARAAWDQELDRLQDTLFAAADVPPSVLADAYANAVYRVTLRRGATPAEKWTAALALIEAMDRRVTDATKLRRAYELAVRLAEAADPQAYAAFLQTRALSPIPEISQWAAGKANVQAAKVEAVAMKFTALDGREVDLAQLRGKVVLIDFWATWCGPCKEEIPNVLANYRKYHDQGFEVVGVSLDLAKDRQKLVDYIRDHELPWPQHFDGQGFKNRFAAQFSINAIPTMFLLNQDGKVVSTDARGAKLEPAIRKLLKLDEAAAPSAAGMLGVGAMAPDFMARDLAGREVRLSDLRGQVVILDFWATWCAPCIASMPHTQAVAAKYANQGVTVLAVCTGDKRTRFEDWVRLKGRDYPALRFVCDPHEQGTPEEKQRASLALYKVPFIPTQFIINRDGRIVGTIGGFRPGDPSLEQALAAAGVRVDPAVLAQRAPDRQRSSEITATTPAARKLPPPFTTSIARLKAGDVLPDLELQGTDGAARRLSEFRGHPLVLMFVTAEMIPAEFLDGVVTQYGEAGVQVLALVTRDTRANLDAWLALHRERSHRFTVAFDPVPPENPRAGAIFRTFQFGAPTPFAIVVDAEGRFVGMFPWKVPEVGPQGLAELLRRCGVPMGGATPTR